MTPHRLAAALDARAAQPRALLSRHAPPVTVLRIEGDVFFYRITPLGAELSARVAGVLEWME